MHLLYTYGVMLLCSILVVARQPPTSFCKCICFQNSTIIALNAPPSESGFRVDKQVTASSTQAAASVVPRNLDSSNLDGQILRREETKPADEEGETKHRELTCNDCNRAFCIDTVCEGAKEEDVFTSCFQRDSLKDEMVVLLFIVLTTSLLAWALLKPYLDKFRDGAPLATYAPLSLSRAGVSERNSSELPVTRGSDDYTGIGLETPIDTMRTNSSSHPDRLGG